jgi:hypothetical protein
VCVGDYDWQVPGGVETSRRHPRGSISREDCSCVKNDAWMSSVRLQSTSLWPQADRGVFKGVMKCRKTPGGREEGGEEIRTSWIQRNGAEMCLG